jgi:hypothetical protein
MRLVVADTGPLHYLVLTGDIELLPSTLTRVNRAAAEFGPTSAGGGRRAASGG